MIYLICKGELFMYHELNDKEIDKFIRKYLYPYKEFKEKIKTKLECFKVWNKFIIQVTI